MEARQVRVHGRVQGVWFRQSTKEQAQRAGVRGWVTNETDGTVKALFAGEPEAVGKLVQWCHEGPAQARVDRVDELSVPVADVPEGFEVR